MSDTEKVKRGDVVNVIYNSMADVTNGQSKHAADKVCELLGDLVEDDQ